MRRIAQAGKRRRGALRQTLVSLDRIDEIARRPIFDCGQFTQNGRLKARTGTDLQYSVRRLRAEGLRHQRHDEWLAYGLSFADGQGRVAFRPAPIGRIHESVARHLRERGPDSGISDSAKELYARTTACRTAPSLVQYVVRGQSSHPDCNIAESRPETAPLSKGCISISLTREPSQAARCDEPKRVACDEILIFGVDFKAGDCCGFRSCRRPVHPRDVEPIRSGFRQSHNRARIPTHTAIRIAIATRL